MYLKALVPLTKLIEAEADPKISKQVHESSVLHYHSQSIPSANRTKADKIRA